MSLEDGHGSSESSDEIPVQSLVDGRQKRTTAGNRLGALLGKAQDDDELELLFAEQEGEEDVEFEDEDEEGAASDVAFDSSSDDEDQPNETRDDDLEGEKELQKAERAERKKKRKAQETFKVPRRTIAKARPGVTIVEKEAPMSKPKKKVERASWLSVAQGGPIRASSRKHTMHNKELVHQRIEENERRRRDQLESMEAAARKKEASKPKAMTQADRMAEALRTEKSNAQSLNRWEASEKKRLEEQKARLAALRNRRLEGPVIRWYSGPAKWADGNLVAVGAKSLSLDPKKSSKPASQKDEPSKRTPATARSKDQDQDQDQDQDVQMTDVPDNPEVRNITQSSPYIIASAEAGSSVLPTSPKDDLKSLSGPNIALGEQSRLGPSDAATPIVNPEQESSITTSAPSEHQISTRNMVVLQSVDADAVAMVPELQNHVLLSRKKTSSRLAKPVQELCAITGFPARYRDPGTGLPYANAYAYAEIQKLKNGGARWSELLGCYVGPISGAANGVPPEFYTK